jgi:Lon protease-like protein
MLLPKYNLGKRRARNPAYQTIENAIARAKRRGDRQAVRVLRKQRRKLPSQDPQDPHYRRLRYVRYADDWVLGFSGPKTEAEEIKRELRDFLRETLKLELSEEKTLITHARTEAAKFLGYHLVSQHVDDKLDHRGERASQ